MKRLSSQDHFCVEAEKERKVSFKIKKKELTKRDELASALRVGVFEGEAQA